MKLSVKLKADPGNRIETAMEKHLSSIKTNTVPENAQLHMDDVSHSSAQRAGTLGVPLLMPHSIQRWGTELMWKILHRSLISETDF